MHAGGWKPLLVRGIHGCLRPYTVQYANILLNSVFRTHVSNITLKGCIQKTINKQLKKTKTKHKSRRSQITHYFFRVLIWLAHSVYCFWFIIITKTWILGWVKLVWGKAQKVTFARWLSLCYKLHLVSSFYEWELQKRYFCC